MKKITKFLVVALSLALLLGAVIGISASAADDGSEGSWVISKNVSYSENIYLMLAVDATKVADQSLLSVNLTIDGVDKVYPFNEFVYKADLYSGDDVATPAYTVNTLGVAAKDMLDTITIEVLYDGESVETTTYSVAEYFYQRLYKDELILATETADVNKKSLYLSSLKYGNAAQKLLASADALYLEDTIYVDSPVAGVDTLFDSRNTLVLPEGYYSVKSYVDGKAVTSVVEGGEYAIVNSAIITDITPAEREKYGLPLNSLTFDSYETGSSWAYDSAASVGVGIGQQTDPIYTATVKEESDGNKYLSLDKTGKKTVDSSNAMLWLTIQNKAHVNGGPNVFESRMSFTPTKGTVIFRFYDGRPASSASGGTEISSSARIKMATSNGYVTLGGVSTGVKAGEWFTLRFVLASTGITAYVVDEYGELTLITSNTIDHSAVTAVQYTYSSDDLGMINCDYIYFGSENMFPAGYTIPTKAETFEGEEAATLDSTSVFGSNVLLRQYIQSAATSTTSIVEENGTKHYSMDKSVGASSNSQTWLVVQRTDTSTSDTKLIFESKMRLKQYDNSSAYLRFYNGRTASNANNGTVFGSGSGRNIMFYSNGGKVYFNKVDTGVKDNEWFVMRLEVSGTTVVGYFYDPDTGALLSGITVDKSSDWSGIDASTATSMVYMNDSNVALKLDMDSVYFGTSKNYDGGFVQKEESDDVPEVTELENAATISTDNTVTGTHKVVKDIITNSYIGITDDLSAVSGSGQPIFRYKSRTSANGFDTYNFETKMKFDKNANGEFVCANTNSGIDYRIQTASSSSKSNVLQVMIYVTNGKLTIRNYQGQVQGEEIVTNISAFKWFTIKATYASKATTATMVVTDGVNEYTLTADVPEAEQVDISAITQLSHVPNTSFVGHVEVKEATIRFSNSAAE